MKLGFWDVDTQVDFILPHGALYVPGAEKLIPNLRRLTDFARRRALTAVATRDAHAPDDPEFKTFPPHCVKGTAGARKIPETTFPAQTVLEKQTFDIFDRPEADTLLEKTGIRDWVVYGVATDYCVRAAVLGLARRGARVTVVSDAIQGIAPATTAMAVTEMRTAGAHFRATDAVLARLTRVLSARKPAQREKLLR
jgi:nicotinamidase/pyrazinamidase